MKRSKIKVGGEYASTRSQDYTRWWDAKRVRVVDLGPFAQVGQHIYQRLDLGVIDGDQVKDNYRREAGGQHVAVRYIDNVDTNVRFIPTSQVKVTWTEYEEARAAVRKAQSEELERAARRKDRIAADQADLAALSARLNLPSDKPGPAWRFDLDGHVVMTRGMFRSLLNAALAVQPTEETER